ncbi:MAG: hypothetical protein RMN25_14470 [Anaerolineae bacterium]|nr:hypothetical protein [Thermoflexales bacterium]MDW8408975.1 hypothetical protein [Anaerolineae bacterium]
MQADVVKRWLAGVVAFRPAAFEEIARSSPLWMASIIVAGGGALVNGIGAWAAGLSIDALIAATLAGVVASLLGWVGVAALLAAVSKSWLLASLTWPSTLRIAGFAALWRWAGVVPISWAGVMADALAVLALLSALLTLGPAKPARVAMVLFVSVGTGFVLHALAGRLMYAILLALGVWISSI